MELVVPGREHLDGIEDAYQRGWSRNTEHDSSAVDLARLQAGREAFLAEFADWSTAGPKITLASGGVVDRVPQLERWLWDGEFGGRISLRALPGTVELPPHVLGHIGYSIVPWKQGKGYATQALRRMLPIAREHGLPYVDLMTRPDNVPSQRVIVNNDGVLLGEVISPPEDGSRPFLHWRITL